VAAAAGVPKTIYNIDSRRRGKIEDKQLPSCRRDPRPSPDQESERRRFAIIASQSGAIGCCSGHDTCTAFRRDQRNDLRKNVGRYVKKHHQAYDNRFNTVSLDQPMPGTETQRWAEAFQSRCLEMR
jgi:hypothetical protein